MRIPSSKRLAVLCLLLGLVALGIAGAFERIRVPAVVLAFAMLSVGALAASRGNAIAASLRPHVTRTVSVTAWGMPVSNTGAGPFVLESTLAIGAGLHLYFRDRSGAKHHMKVAQPNGVAVDNRRAEIRDARYVSWDARKLTSGGGTAVVLEVLPTE